MRLFAVATQPVIAAQPVVIEPVIPLSVVAPPAVLAPVAEIQVADIADAAKPRPTLKLKPSLAKAAEIRIDAPKAEDAQAEAEKPRATLKLKSTVDLRRPRIFPAAARRSISPPRSRRK